MRTDKVDVIATGVIAPRETDAPTGLDIVRSEYSSLKHMGYWEIAMLKSILVSNDFQTWHLIGWHKSLLTNMRFNMDFTAVTPVRQQWSYCSIALSHQYSIYLVFNTLHFDIKKILQTLITDNSFNLYVSSSHLIQRSMNIYTFTAYVLGLCKYTPSYSVNTISSPLIHTWPTTLL